MRWHRNIESLRNVINSYDSLVVSRKCMRQLRCHVTLAPEHDISDTVTVGLKSSYHRQYPSIHIRHLLTPYSPVVTIAAVHAVPQRLTPSANAAPADAKYLNQHYFEEKQSVPAATVFLQNNTISFTALIFLCRQNSKTCTSCF